MNQSPLPYPLLKDADLSGKRVLLRAGFDVPTEDGKVVDISRIEALVPTMQEILKRGASLVIMAHQGRPKDKPDPAFSQKPLVPVLEQLLNVSVAFAESCIGEVANSGAAALKPGGVLLLENLRFDPREKRNDPEFARKLASLADIYVNDAFTNCHRAHASMVGVPQLLPSFMGLQLEQEVRHLSAVTKHPEHPVALVISGAKMETKIPVIRHFMRKGDDVLVGGCIANAFISASGRGIGRSMCETEFIPTCRELLGQSGVGGSARIHVPVDAVVAPDPAHPEAAKEVPTDAIAEDLAMFDIGSATADAYVARIAQAKTIIWNGPLGLYETERFSRATKRIAQSISQACSNGATAVLGGGDTIDFHTRYGLPLSAYTYVSTGGGAMLEFIGGGELPALKALQRK
ncbi:phosphoglycerate kinase [Candidatus Peribacteria bacterium]|nr:phosphoglycerate kinase [Candidatus Peribacteria bacterium]